MVLCTKFLTGRLCISLLLWCCISQRRGLEPREKPNMCKFNPRILRKRKVSYAVTLRVKNVTFTIFWHIQGVTILTSFSGRMQAESSATMQTSRTSRTLIQSCRGYRITSVTQSHHAHCKVRLITTSPISEQLK